MRIALIAPTPIPARRANTFQVMKMAQAMALLGHQVHLASPGDPPAGLDQDALAQELMCHYGLQNALFSSSEFPITWLPASPSLRRYDFSLRAVRWARHWKADLLYTRLPQTAALSSSLGFPTILEIHDLPRGFTGPRLVRLFARGKGARRLVVITQALAEDLMQRVRAQDRFGSPIQVIVAPDGVDLARYADLPEPAQARLALGQGSPASPHPPLPPERFTAGYTGHLYPGRGSDLLLELAERLQDITFLITGGDPQDVARLSDQARQKSLDNVILTGFVPNSELPLYQAACDILLMPYLRRVEASSGGDISRYLSPMKLFEYLACQRPILSSDLPVLQEVLNEHNAVIMPTADLEVWVQAIQDLRQDPERRQDLAAQARLDASRYTWETRAAKILEGLQSQE